MTDIQRNLITNVKHYRKQRGLTQMQLAEQCSVSASYIGEIEIGRKFPSPRIFQTIADVLGVKPYRLIMDEAALNDFSENAVIDLYSNKIKKELINAVDKVAEEHFSDSVTSAEERS